MLPAYAGMILASVDMATWTDGAPRVCGDDPYDRLLYYDTDSCSPRMRG